MKQKENATLILSS